MGTHKQIKSTNGQTNTQKQDHNPLGGGTNNWN